MPDLDTVRSWEARTMVDRDGTRIGPIQAIYLDDRTGEAEWALVNTGLFGTKASFVPSKALLEVDSSADREAVTVSRGTLGRVDIVVGPEGPAIMWPKLTAWLETHSRVDR